MSRRQSPTGAALRPAKSPVGQHPSSLLSVELGAQQAATSAQNVLSELLQAVDRLSSGLILMDGAGIVRCVNAAAAQLLGSQPEPLLNQAAAMLIDALAHLSGDCEPARRQLETLFSEQDTRSSVRLLTPQGAEPSAVLLHRLHAGNEGPLAGYQILLLLPDRADSPIAQVDAGELPHMLSAIGEQLGRIEAAATLQTHPGAQRRGESVALVQLLEKLARQVQSARSALDDIAALHTLQTNVTPLHLAPVTLSDLLMEIMPQWQIHAPLHSFELALQGEDPEITADAEYLARALHIMLEAAASLAPSGGTIRVHVRPGVDDVGLVVRHHGPALTEEEQQAIFHPFYVLASSGNVLVHGGIGLSLARAVFAAHGGRLWAETPPSGPGLALRATLPLIPLRVAATTRTEPGPLEDPAALAPTMKATQPRARPLALIADGDPRMLRYLRANLEAQQYRVTIATHSGELEQQIDLDEPDIILLDTCLPGSSNSEQLRRLRELRLSDSPQIIMLTRQHDPDECARYLDAGAADYIIKPFAMEELLARLRVALRTREALTRGALRDVLFQCGDMSIDFHQRTVTIAGNPVRLSKTEYKLLRVLAQHAGMVLSHDVLLERVWGPGYSHEVEFLWVYIRRLRRKIEADPSAPRRILTISGVGYQLARG